jgi:ribose transport system substrate-binding protein
VPIPKGPVGDSKKTYKIGCVFHGFDHPWLINWADSAKWQANQHPNVEMSVLDAEYDNAKMASYIDQFIAEGVDGIMLWPMEVAPTGPPVKRALAAGIPVVSSDRLTGSDKINARVTGGLPSNGAQMGMYLAWKLAQEGNLSAKIVMLRKPLGASSEALRTGYMLKVLSYLPGIEILQSYHDTDSREEAFKNAQVALQAFPDIDIFYSTGDHEALAAIEAVKQANRMNSREGDKKIIFVTPDDSKESMKLIDEGILETDVPLTPLQADIATRVLINIMIGKEMPHDVIVPDAPMVTKKTDNIVGFTTQTIDQWYEYTWGPPVK